MCVRISPLTEDEAESVLAARGMGGGHVIRYIEAPDPTRDARPGARVPVYVPSKTGALEVAMLEWGFPLDGRPHAVFNTRIETVLDRMPLVLGPSESSVWLGEGFATLTDCSAVKLTSAAE